MSTFRDLTGPEFNGRITLCASGACVEHLEFVRDGVRVEIMKEDVQAIRAALDEFERFVVSRGGKS